MPIFTPSEARAFNEDLNRYQAQEISADKRDAWVESRVKDMLMDKYCPFRAEKIQEAMEEMEDEDYEKFNTLVDKPDSREELTKFKEEVSKKYWTAIAVFKAQEEYDKAWF